MITFLETLGELVAGLLLCAGLVMILRQAAYNQRRKKWAKDIRPGKGLGL